MNENPDYHLWTKSSPPRRILFIRLQAMGDVTITFPYIQGFKKLFPEAEVDFLTREESGSIPKILNLFSKVHILRGGRNAKKQAICALFLLFTLRKCHYDIVVDLQNNKISRMIRKSLAPPAWSQFDRLSAIPAGVRTENTIKNIGLGECSPVFGFSLSDEITGINLLKDAGWKKGHLLVVLNPAGFLSSRNWPLEFYVEFSQLLLRRFDDAQFLVLGIERIREKANYLQEHLGERLINLVGKTSPATAFSIMQKASIVLTEDSGLMHMAWVSGKATVALFGSSRSDWSRPLGAHSVCLNSSDMECGECMQAECKFGDVRCLTRFTPQMVYDEAIELLRRIPI